MTRTQGTRTIFLGLADAAIVFFLVFLACIATVAMHDYRERTAEAERLQRAHTAGMAIGAGMCVKEPQQ